MFITSLLVSTGVPVQVVEAAGGPSVPLPKTSSVPVTEQTMQPRPQDEAARDALKGDQPAGAGEGKPGVGKYEATSLRPSATWDVSAHTGDFTWDYPLRVPPVPGSLQPELALSFSPGSLDGLTSATNTQASWVGDGWSLWPGFIERSYGSCRDDLPGDGAEEPADLCWRSDNATLSYGGSGSALIKDDRTGVWRPESDDGSRIERLTGAANGDDNGEHWKVTDVDGGQYFYGSRPESKSTWTVPVFGDDAGEPCHAGDFAASSCTQGYRWNLDKVVDPHGNVIHYAYDTVTNRYGSNNNSRAVDYVRDGWLSRVDYGLACTPSTRPNPRHGSSSTSRTGASRAQPAPVTNRRTGRTCHGAWSAPARRAERSRTLRRSGPPSGWPRSPPRCGAVPGSPISTPGPCGTSSPRQAMGRSQRCGWPGSADARRDYRSRRSLHAADRLSRLSNRGGGRSASKVGSSASSLVERAASGTGGASLPVGSEGHGCGP
ncbi:hypothetical protein ACWEV3_15960 [Saccharopolyspora sp. NPDC003752]